MEITVNGHEYIPTKLSEIKIGQVYYRDINDRNCWFNKFFLVRLSTHIEEFGGSFPTRPKYDDIVYLRKEPINQ